jgi:hypothetical protein
VLHPHGGDAQRATEPDIARQARSLLAEKGGEPLRVGTAVIDMGVTKSINVCDSVMLFELMQWKDYLHLRVYKIYVTLCCHLDYSRVSAHQTVAQGSRVVSSYPVDSSATAVGCSTY